METLLTGCTYLNTLLANECIGLENQQLEVKRTGLQPKSEYLERTRGISFVQ